MIININYLFNLLNLINLVNLMFRNEEFIEKETDSVNNENLRITTKVCV